MTNIYCKNSTIKPHTTKTTWPEKKLIRKYIESLKKVAANQNQIMSKICWLQLCNHKLVTLNSERDKVGRSQGEKTKDKAVSMF